jgi:hypothetical protein
MNIRSIATIVFILSHFATSAQASDKDVVILNTPLPVTVTNPVTSVDVSGTVDASGSSVNATIVGTPEVSLSNDVLSVSSSTDLSSMRPVTLLQRVNSDNQQEDRTGDTTQTFVTCISDACYQSDDLVLSDQIRVDSDTILIVTSITAINFNAPMAPDVTDYSMLNIGKCHSSSFPSNVGIGAFTIDGRTTTHLTFTPGVVVSDLSSDERVCFTSAAQSTIDADVTLHGYLTARP